MTDTIDPRFERDLRRVLADAAPADAPAALRFFATDVVHRPVRRRLPFGWSGRTYAALAGGAAVAVLAVGMGGAIARLPVGLPWDLPAIGALVPTPTLPTSIHGVWINYQVLPADGKHPGLPGINVISTIMLGRLRAMGVAMETASIAGQAPDQVTADIGLVDGSQDQIDAFRRVLGTRGRLDFVALGDTSMSQGDSIDLTVHPSLFSNEAIAAAEIGSDQTGRRTIDFTLSSDGASAFATFSAANVGSYFAIALDGVVISAPLINELIADGRLQISGGEVGGFTLEAAQQLVAVVGSGPLPFPVEEISVVTR